MIDSGRLPKYHECYEPTRSELEARIAELEAENTRLRECADAMEQRYRALMWNSHGHQLRYGDDGEMQCGECSQYGCWDYKNAPLKEVEAAYLKAIMARAAFPREEAKS